ncbi:RNI-like protein [Polyporus arcularius HHB13444]|uniref:RNI-like protein n=1 Tax=Polyporus arcularius HHB13444 TaxID=1314778 RepID=A0A5C3Q3G6_9APHY|nr:RNI-like protein [Polyporus arcularius HHB13444]
MAYSLPTVGTRINHSGALGTVRYVGPVNGTQGVWLGVEWDDPKRGKHDGVKDGKRYFTCLVPNSGSFIRPTAAGVSYGVSFLRALTAKYIEIPHGSASLEKVILGSSGGAIEVEAVGLDKIRNKLARLERLREVSLDNESVSSADPPGEISRTCPGIRGLDLSKNLISGWDTVAAITIELANLRSLSLNSNRLIPPERSQLNVLAFQRLEELQLSGTLVSWAELQILLPHMPALSTVELGYNRMKGLSSDRQPQSTWPRNTTVQTVNLDSNELDSIHDISSATYNLSRLQRLILTSNSISKIDPPRINEDAAKDREAASPPTLRGIKHLALAFNRIATWYDIDMLQHWCPELESLTLAGNPLIDDPTHAMYARAFTVAKIPSLKSLDGTAISTRERTDNELLYLSYIAKQTFTSEDEKRAAHPQWEALKTKHGISDAPAAPKAQDTLSSRLTTIRIYHGASAPPASLPPNERERYLGECKSELTLRVLPTMSVRTLRMKLMKSFKIPKAQQSSVRLWMALPDGHFIELDEEFTGRDLAYWGVDADTQFVLVDN